MHKDLIPLLSAICETLDQNELSSFDENSKLLLLVDCLLKCQEPFNISPDSVRNPSHLFNWFQENNGKSQNIDLLEMENHNYGLKCTGPLKQAEPVVKIPKAELIMADCSNCLELSLICNKDSTLCNMPNLRLSLNLLNEKLNPNSFWHDYLSSLPTSYHSLLYFSSEDFQMLKPSTAFPTCARLYCKLLGCYVYLHSLFFGKNSEEPGCLTSKASSLFFTPENFTFAAFRWAISTIMTRQNNVPIGGGLALVPVLDMINHNPTLGPSVDFDDEKEEVVVYAPKDFKTGEEFKIFYGQRSNHDLLVHNAFALENNPSDSFYLILPFQMTENADEKRTKLVRRLGIERDCFKLTLAQPLPRSLLACLHIEFAPEEVIEKWLSQSIADSLDEVVEEKPARLGADVYRKAYVWLTAQVGRRLRGYKEHQLPEEFSKRSDIASNINILLTCERQILEGVITSLQSLLQK